MDQSDVEYAELMKELETEMFSNQCCQERLGEHLWSLQKKRGKLQSELERAGSEESRARSHLEEELCSNDEQQEGLRQQLQELEKRLRVLKATASAEELMQDEATEVHVDDAMMGLSDIKLSVHVCYLGPHV